MSCFSTVLLLRSSVALVETYFSYMEQGGGVGCVAEVLVNF